MQKITCFITLVITIVVTDQIFAQSETEATKDSIAQKYISIPDSTKEKKVKKHGFINFVDISESWSVYQPATLDPLNWRPPGLRSDTLMSLLRHDIALFNQNRLDPAIDSLLLATELDSLNPNLFNLVGVRYGRSGHLDEAKLYLLKAIEINAAFYKAINNLGNVYFKESDFEKAYRQYKEAAALAGSNADILINWAYAALELGDIDEAVELENRAFELNQSRRSEKKLEIITEFEAEIAMKASEGMQSTLEPIWIE